MIEGGTSVPPDVPPEAVAFLREVGYFDAERLREGDAVPPITLARLDGTGGVTLGAPTARPTVLIFGSYT